ncbi:LOW QUALITY PROTEIN: hypothetical protein ACHAXT_010906 [Thalassiosira profunda]
MKTLRLVTTGGLALLATYHQAEAFSSSRQPLHCNSSRARSTPTTQLPAVPPSDSSTVGTVGSGYLPVLAAKLAAHRGHGASWIICPAADIEIMQQLTETGSPNLELVPASDTDRVEELLRETDALMVATDDVDSVVAPSVLEYLLDPSKAPHLQRVVAMSRNLNGSGMGMLATASRKAANAQVWDNSNAAAYREYEQNIKDLAEKCGAEWTVVRAGSLKGGACGEGNAYPQYLAEAYYELTKTDLITWQLLFDCETRGVKLAKGDVLPGPGISAVFAATGSGEHAGGAAWPRPCLEIDEAAGAEFGVGTVASREVPTEAAWEGLLRACLSS